MPRRPAMEINDLLQAISRNAQADLLGDVQQLVGKPQRQRGQHVGKKVVEHADEHADVHAAEKVLDIEQIRQYRRDGFVVVKGVLSAQMVALCNAALSDLAQGRIDKTTTNIYFEAGQDVAGLSAEEAELRVRRFDSFCSDSEVLLRAAM